jgi:hypothetical protein
VRFRWLVEPATDLYRRSEFFLRFPEDIDPRRVPDSIWWFVEIACLHSQWLFLRPCRVEIPAALGHAATEFWLRQLDTGVAMLEAHRGTADTARSIEIVGGAEVLAPPDPLENSRRCAAAFSGGKDSLLQAGLLCELTENPLLVTTTSPMSILSDHATARRRHVLAEIVRRRPVRLVEVESDFRSAWDPEYPRRLGYRPAINEMADSFLYASALLASARSLGAGRLFIASEAEVQESAEIGGRIVPHPHFMYSAATLRALSRWIEPWGMSISSLTPPLHSAQVQRLLWTRYPDLCDLQYSCWQVRPGESACNACGQCLRIAVSALSIGRDPEAMGIDLARLLPAMRDWAPSEGREPAALPIAAVRRELDRQVAREAARVRVRTVAAALGIRLATRRGRTALGSFLRLRRRLRAFPAGPAPGYRRGFLSFVDPQLRDRVGEIYESAFPAEDESRYAGILRRSELLAARVSEPLAGA